MDILDGIELIIFDLDGTLSEFKTGDLLPGVAEWFSDPANEKYLKAVATNQGGVGLRYWMETGGWGQPEKYPTEETILNLQIQICEALGNPFKAFYTAFAYQSKQGHWSPTPPESEGQPNWQQEWRKPAPGMLLQAMADCGGIRPSRTLMVGDWPEDEQAAAAAFCRYCPADQFFNRFPF